MTDSEDRTLKDFLEQLKGMTGLSADDVQQVEQMLLDPSVAETASGDLAPSAQDSSAPNPKEDEERALRFRLADMTIPQKIKLALFGDATCRALLISDPNKVISLAVLRNSKINPGEAEDFAKNANLSDQVLRDIAANSTWTRSYKLKLNLVMNPKTPQDVSLRWLKHLNAFDLKRVSKSRNIPQLITSTARKIVAEQNSK